MILVHTDALLTLAEVSATFAGFAALVTLFARRRLEGAATHDLLRLRLVIGLSIVAVMASLVPVAIAGFGLPETMTWQFSAAIFLMLTYFVFGSFIASYSTAKTTFPPDKLAVFVAVVLEILIQLALILVLFGIIEAQSYGLYVSALISTIGQAAFVFLRLISSTFSTIVYNTELTRVSPKQREPFQSS
jgi:hypothetical protein